MVFLVSEGYFKVCSSEDVSDVRSFFAGVCEGGPFWGGCRLVWVGWFGGVRFVGSDREGV